MNRDGGSLTCDGVVAPFERFDHLPR